jgi:NET1-associated nuclear protein 1 (U3 small nucleolar RNA-associated protein 17)
VVFVTSRSGNGSARGERSDPRSFRGADGRRYLVNSQFPGPHDLAKISSIAFSPVPMTSVPSTVSAPNYPYLLTTAKDGTAKIWQVRQARKSEHGEFTTCLLSRAF